jgi:drug/metabolite transporter (DMT)-like permease
MKTSNKFIPIFMMLVAMNLIALGDTGGKLLSQNNVDSFFTAWSRFAIGAVCLLPFCRLQLSELPSLLNWRILLRASFITVSISSILTALSTEPIANVFSAFFLGPILSYFLAAYFLKEKITLIRTILLLIGFGGVLLVVKPGLDMSNGMLFAVLAGCAYSGFLVTSRWLAQEYRPRFLLISQLFFGTIILLPFGANHIPVTIDVEISSLILLSALGSAIGNLLLIEVNRRLPANIVAPLVYTVLIFASLYGVLVFSTWPDTWSLIGMLIILISGLSSWFISDREN